MIMARWIDPRYFNTLIDAHVLDRTGGPQDADVGEILRLGAEGDVSLVLPYSVKHEIEHPNTPAYVKQRATGLSYTIQVDLTPGERELYQRVLQIIQGDAKPGKHARDARHLVESDKYGGGYFLTNDGRLLKKAAGIGKLLNMEIVTPAGFLEKYREAEAKWPRPSR